MSVGHVLLLWVLFWPLMLLPGHCGDRFATSYPSHHEQSCGLKPLKTWAQVNLPARLSRCSVTTAGSWPPSYALSKAVKKGAGSLLRYYPKAHRGTQKAVWLQKQCRLGDGSVHAEHSKDLCSLVASRGGKDSGFAQSCLCWNPMGVLAREIIPASFAALHGRWPSLC